MTRTQGTKQRRSIHRCIYCLQDKVHVEFNREHVFPDGFGKLNGALTLHSCEVCKECNSYFDKVLDRALLRDTGIGLMRFIVGARHPSEYKHAGRRSRLKSQYTDGPRPGVLVHVECAPTDLAVTEVPQVIFRDNAGCRHAYSISQLPSFSQLPLGCDANHVEIRGTADMQEVAGALRRAGYELLGHETPREEQPTGPVHVRTTWTLDDTDRRALMKIAFNYLTYVSGPSVALQDEFNATRGFIRSGEALGYDYVAVLPAMRNDPRRCTVALAMDGFGSPAVHLEFFGAFGLLLRMSTRRDGPDLGRHAHLYDFARGSVVPLKESTEDASSPSV